MFSAAQIQQALSQLALEKKVFLSGNLAADAAWWEGLARKASAAIAAEHRAHPERPGLPLNELRSHLEKDLRLPDVFEVLITHLLQRGYVRTGPSLRQATHRPMLPPPLQAIGDKLRATLAAKPLEPPSRKELAPDNLSKQALRFLVENGEAVELGDEVVLLAESYQSAVAAIQKHLREKGAATVSDLRQVLGSSRRIVVPLLERLDRDGVTLRQGDQRILKK
jgi:selenocysteine-specific elongation factor